MNLRRRLRRTSQRGSAAVEFAIVAPVLILMLFGIVEFGLYIQEQTLVSNAAREGARTASFGGLEADIDTSVQDALGTTPYTVTVTATCATPVGDTCDLGTAGNIAQVTVNVAYTGITGMFPILDNVQIASTSHMRIET